MVVKLSGQGTQYCIVGGCGRSSLPLLFQTICLLWPTCLHCCPQKNDFSPLDVSVQKSPDQRSWPSCGVPFIYGEVDLPHQYTNRYSPGCINSLKEEENDPSMPNWNRGGGL